MRRGLRRLTRRRNNPLERDHIKIAAELAGVGLFLLLLVQAIRKP